MRLAGKRKRKLDPVKGARVLLVEPDPAELDRLGEAIRAVGCKVMALGKLDAVVPMARVFRPDLAIVGVSAPDLEATRVGRRLWQRFNGSVPVIYVGDLEDRADRHYCLDGGRGVEVISRADAHEDLGLRIRRLLTLKTGVAATVRSEYELRSPSLHDGVTGLYNRSFLLEMVATEVRRGERHGGSFTVMIAELNDFVHVREEHGDEACDRLMVYCSVLLREALREADVVARVGRFHFGALLPGMEQEAVALFLSRLRRRFALARIQVGGKTIRARMTFGTATFPDVLGPAQQIFSKAIQELDEARVVGGTGPRAAV